MQTTDINTLFQSIDAEARDLASLHLTPELRAVLSERPGSNYRFNILHYEVLLAEATQMLERAFSIRAEHDRLMRETTSADAMSQEFKHNIQLIEKEVEVGRDGIDFEQAKQDLKVSENILKRLMTTQEVYLRELSGLIETKWKPAQDGEYRFPAPPDDGMADPAPANDGAAGAEPQPTPRVERIETAGGLAGLGATLHSDQLTEAGRKRETLLLDAEIFRLKRDLETLRQDIIRHTASAASARRQIALLEVSHVNRASRRDFLQEQEAERLERRGQAGNAENTAEQVSTLQQRLQLEVQSASERVYCARAGILHIFGKNPLVDERAPSFAGVVGDQLSHLYSTTRGLTEELSIMARSDQEITLRLSVKDLVAGQMLRGGAGWDADIKNRRFIFTIVPRLFPTARIVKLQSVAVSVTSTNAQRDVWQMILTMPDQKIPLRPITTMEALGATPAPSISIPEVFLGAVTHHHPDVFPDEAGGLGLMNVNPLGEWTLAVQGGQGAVDGLQDIRLELRVVITPEM